MLDFAMKRADGLPVKLDDLREPLQDAFPAVMRTASRIASNEKLSSRIERAPCASAVSSCSSVSTSI